MWASTLLSLLTPYLLSSQWQSPHQCGVRIGLYTLSSRRGLCIGYRIMKGVSERCIARLLLTIQPDPIVIPPHSENNFGSTSQQATAKDRIPQQTDTLKPGKTRVYPSMLAEKQVPVLNLTISTITSEADLQTAFHSLNLCSTKKEDPSHGRKQSSTEEDTH